MGGGNPLCFSGQLLGGCILAGETGTIVGSQVTALTGRSRIRMRQVLVLLGREVVREEMGGEEGGSSVWLRRKIIRSAG